MSGLGTHNLKLDLQKTTNEIIEFIRRIFANGNANGVVVGLSGGVDSSLTVTLCVRALGKERVMGIILPLDFTPPGDILDAQEIADWLGIMTESVSIQKIGEAFFKEFRIEQNDLGQRLAVANIYARIRMIILYYYANLNRYLVAGTGDRSELLIGYFTKYGDGGADFFPTAHLYKTQVRELAKHLGVPDRIAYKPSSPQLYPGHQATDEIPLSYEKLDPLLVELFDQGLSPKEVGRMMGVPVGLVKEVLRRFNESKHKRAYPMMVRV